MNKDYETLSSELAYENPFFKITKEEYIRHDGEKKTHYLMNKVPSVFIIPVGIDNTIYMVKQFRYPTKKWSLELPAGSTDGEDSLEAAKRELWEETGLKADRWLNLGEYQVAPGLSSNIGHIWLAKGLTMTTENKQKEEGIVECIKLSITDIKSKILDGTISDGPTLAVFGKVFWGIEGSINTI
jgi:ADP-ribose pyrophosphatase